MDKKARFEDYTLEDAEYEWKRDKANGVRGKVGELANGIMSLVAISNIRIEEKAELIA